MLDLWQSSILIPGPDYAQPKGETNGTEFVETYKAATIFHEGVVQKACSTALDCHRTQV